MNDDTDSTPAAAPVTPVPLLQMLQLPDLPGLSEADGGAPVCGPDGCAVPARPAPGQPQQ